MLFYLQLSFYYLGSKLGYLNHFLDQERQSDSPPNITYWTKLWVHDFTLSLSVLGCSIPFKLHDSFHFPLLGMVSWDKLPNACQFMVLVPFLLHSHHQDVKWKICYKYYLITDSEYFSNSGGKPLLDSLLGVYPSLWTLLAAKLGLVC